MWLGMFLSVLTLLKKSTSYLRCRVPSQCFQVSTRTSELRTLNKTSDLTKLPFPFTSKLDLDEYLQAILVGELELIPGSPAIDS